MLHPQLESYWLLMVCVSVGVICLEGQGPCSTAGPHTHSDGTYWIQWVLTTKKEDITEGKESIDGLSKSGRGQIWDRYDQDTLQSWAQCNMSFIPVLGGRGMWISVICIL